MSILVRIKNVRKFNTRYDCYENLLKRNKFQYQIDNRCIGRIFAKRNDFKEERFGNNLQFAVER